MCLGWHALATSSGPHDLLLPVCCPPPTLAARLLIQSPPMPAHGDWQRPGWDDGGPRVAEQGESIRGGLAVVLGVTRMDGERYIVRVCVCIAMDPPGGSEWYPPVPPCK